MKTFRLIVGICLMGSSVFAQDTTKTNKYLNEFGIDVTGFLKQYLNFGSNQSPGYSPVYYITYRRHFSCGNLRIEIGGDYTNDQMPSPYNNDSSLRYSKGYSLNAGIGWEFYNNLSKRWQIFYGADVRTSLIYSNTDAGYYIGQNGYEMGTESNTQIYAIAPLLGVRFKITKRLSILTETSYSIDLEKDMNSTYPVATPGVSLPMPPSSSQKNTKMYSSFSQPLSLFLDFTI